jgi:hypothetical protein
MIDIRTAELGYYKVGDSIHLSKVSALVDGTQKGIHPEWKFNEYVFNTVDWSIEPAEDLRELYRQRAQQLREKYDYLILSYSAGGDSQTVLDTFLNNNIRIDEVFVAWPKGLEKTYVPNPNDLRYTNVFSEWDYLIKPKLDWLAKNHPEVKITIHDWSEDILDYKVEDGYVMERGHMLTPYASARMDAHNSKSIKEHIEKHDNTCLVLGIDKPRICWKDGAYQIYFLDIVTVSQGHQSVASTRENGVLTEFFYWSPDSIKILQKQAHMLVRFFESVANFRQYITWPSSNPKFRQWYEASIKAIIYPDYDLRYFQVDKPPDMVLGYDVVLFNLGLEDRIRGITRENFQYLQRVIDPKYFNVVNGLTSLIGFVSPMWVVKKGSCHDERRV